MKKYRYIIVFLAIVLTVFAGLDIAARLNPPRYYINLSESMPIGVYELLPFDGHLKIGDIIIFDVPEPARPYIYGRGWLPKGWMLIKKVGALPGNKISITDDAIYINDKYIGPIFQTDAEGLPLPKFKGNFIVPATHCLPIATDIQNSFDGRYFGVIPYNLIRGRGKALLIFQFK